MDVVYINRPGDDNEELRYSLRSLRNLPHGKVFVSGYCPVWVQGVEVISQERMRDKQTSALTNLIAALNCNEVSDPFVIFNDDFFVMQPLEEVPLLHLGDLDAFIEEHGQSTYRKAMEATRDRLAQTETGPFLSWESHAPMVIEKLGMQLALSIGQGIHGMHNRTMYGNLMGLVGKQSHDFKVYRTSKGNEYKGWPFVSTSDRTFVYHPVGRYIREAFPDPSPYEKPIPITRSGRAIRYQSVVIRP